MLYAMILVCSLATTPEPSNCDLTSAVRFEHTPEHSALPLMCFKLGTEWFATHSKPPAPGEYLRVICSHSRFTGTIG